MKREKSENKGLDCIDVYNKNTVLAAGSLKNDSTTVQYIMYKKYTLFLLKDFTTVQGQQKHVETCFEHPEIFQPHIFINLTVCCLIIV
jgi:hypothetical protein